MKATDSLFDESVQISHPGFQHLATALPKSVGSQDKHRTPGHTRTSKSGTHHPKVGVRAIPMRILGVLGIMGPTEDTQNTPQAGRADTALASRATWFLCFYFTELSINQGTRQT